jgi:hypothetical protein
MGMSDADVRAGRLREFITSLRGQPGRGPLLAAAIARWTAVAPAEAMDFCLTLPPADALEGLKAGLPIWTRMDQQAALAWAMSHYQAGTLPGGVVRAVPSIFYQWARQDMPGAFNLMGGMETLMGRGGPQPLFRQGIGAVALLDDQRESALNSIRDFMLRNADIDPGHWKDYLQLIAAQQPALAAEWLERQTTLPPEHLKVATEFVVGQWARSDPTGALTWASDGVLQAPPNGTYKVNVFGGQLTVTAEGKSLSQRSVLK